MKRKLGLVLCQREKEPFAEPQGREIAMTFSSRDCPSANQKRAATFGPLETPIATSCLVADREKFMQKVQLQTKPAHTMVKKTKTEATKKADAAPPAGGLFGSSAKVDASLASLFATKVSASSAILEVKY